MKAKTPKVYTLAQVGKLLNVTGRSIRNYVKVGLIHAIPGPKHWMVVTEEELQRVKRDGINTSGVTAKLAKLAQRGAARTTAKKQTKRDAVGATAKKKSAYARTVTKKQVKRNAAAATRTPAKKQTKRGGVRGARKK